MALTRKQWLEKALADHESALLRYARHLCGDLVLAEDLVQEAFLRLCKEKQKKIGENAAPWLFRVCRNLFVDRTRRAKTQRDAQPAVFEVESERQTEVDPETKTATLRDLNKLNQALVQLSPKYQEIVRLKFEHGFSYKEIAKITGLSPTNVGYCLHQALQELRLIFGSGELQSEIQ